MADLWDEEFDEMIEELLDELEEELERRNEPPPALLNKDGSVRKRRRTNESYGRGEKDHKPPNPHDFCKWLLHLQHEDTADPSTRKGKDWRRTFRLPLQVFNELVAKCR